jgi:hypothetical protein
LTRPASGQRWNPFQIQVTAIHPEPETSPWLSGSDNGTLLKNLEPVGDSPAAGRIQEEISMEEFKMETVIDKDGSLRIDALPFPAGVRVEVIVRTPEKAAEEQKPTSRYPLRGATIRYDDPFESVAGDDWDAAR